MWQLTVKGRPYGPKYKTEPQAIRAYTRLAASIHHLLWRRVG